MSVPAEPRLDPSRLAQQGVDTTRSIEDLEGHAWGSPKFGSYVVTRSHALGEEPLNVLTAEDVRVALVRKIGLEYVVPLALSALAENPALDARYDEGDVLRTLLCIPSEF